jgi:hypothetical protein
MAKKRTPRGTPATHFEQVPLSAVKAIAKETVGKAQPGKSTGPDKAAEKKARVDSHFHAVQFYDSPDTLCRIVGRFIGEGLARGAAATLIVTPDHATRIDTCVRLCGFDVDAITQDGRLVILDARDTLNQFMVDGMPNASAFRRTVGGLLAGIRRSTGDRPIRAYGEMVDLLWKDGREAAAIRLETLWNQLASSYDFELLCGYSMGNFYKGSSLEDIQHQHTHLMPADGSAAVPVAARA